MALHVDSYFAAYNFDALFAITLIPFEFLHVRLFTLSNIYTGRI